MVLVLAPSYPASREKSATVNRFRTRSIPSRAPFLPGRYHYGTCRKTLRSARRNLMAATAIAGIIRLGDCTVGLRASLFQRRKHAASLGLRP